MNRKILSIAFIALSTILSTSVANNLNTDLNDKKDVQECCKTHKMKKKKAYKSIKFNPFEGITLSKSQKEQLQTIADDCRVERQKMSQNKKVDLEVKREGYKEMRKKHLERIKQILTSEQYITYLENIAIGNSKKQKKQMFLDIDKKRYAKLGCTCHKKRTV